MSGGTSRTCIENFMLKSQVVTEISMLKEIKVLKMVLDSYFLTK